MGWGICLPFAMYVSDCVSPEQHLPFTKNRHDISQSMNIRGVEACDEITEKLNYY